MNPPFMINIRRFFFLHIHNGFVHFVHFNYKFYFQFITFTDILHGVHSLFIFNCYTLFKSKDR